jgi:enoyl-CoA hydratase/carnithine racemase
LAGNAPRCCVYTARQLGGEEAFAWGLGEVFTEQANVRAAAVELAGRSPRMHRSRPICASDVVAGRVAEIKAATAREYREQTLARQTTDHKEGYAAVAERRPGRFVGR